MSPNSAAVNVKSLSDDDIYDEEKIFLKMGRKKDSPGVVFLHPHTSNVLS